MTVNRHLGRYELLEQLGEGGMGAVWLARLSGSHGFEKLCIVKTVLPSISKDADFVSRFLHEGRVLTQLAHGNIAQVLDMNEVEGQLFLALEYVAGVDLARLADNVRAANEFMPLPLVVALIAQAAEGLGAAHRKTALDGTPLNVVHRDVSPQNIMVSFEGEVKVIDFGIAKSEARSRHTAQASVMGKLGYMAPEQARGENVDHRADQYALAIVLWELLTNQPFIRRGTLTEMVVAMAHPRERPVTPLRGDVTKSLEAVVTRALSAAPDARYPDTDAFARALTAEVLALGPPPTKPQLGEYVKAKCTQEFGAQRQLLTRVSTMRGLSSESVRATSSDPLVATAVRPGPPVSAPQVVTPAATVEVSSHTVAARPGLVDPTAMTRARAVGAVPVDARDLPPEASPSSGPSDPSPTVRDRPPGLDAALDATRGSGSSDPAPTVNDRPPGLDAMLAAKQSDSPALDATMAAKRSSALDAARRGDASPLVDPAKRSDVPASLDAVKRSEFAPGDATMAAKLDGPSDRPSGHDGATVPGRAAVSSADATSAGRLGVERTSGGGARSLGDSTVPGRPAVSSADATSAGRPGLERASGEGARSLGDSTEPGRPAVSSAVVPAQGTPAISVPSQPLLAPLTTGEIAAAIPKRSKAPLIVGAVAVVGLIAAVFFATRPPEKTEPTDPRPPVAVVADAGVAAPPVEVAAADAGVAPVAVADPPNDAPKPAEGAITNPPGFEDPPTQPTDSSPSDSKKPIRFLVRATATTWIVSNANKSTLKGCTLTFPGKRRFSLGTFRNGESREISHAAATVSAGAPSVDKKVRLDCAEGTGFTKL